MVRARVTQKDILYLSISLFVVVAAWIGFNIYHTSVTTKIAQEVQVQVTPIDPTFDLATVQKLKQRQRVAPLNDIVVSSKSASAPLPTPTIAVATGSARTQSISPTIGILRQGQ